MELAANKVPNTRIHERAAGRVILGLVKWWIYEKALLLILTNPQAIFVTVIMSLLSASICSAL